MPSIRTVLQIVTALFAGFETTSVSIARMLELLPSPGGEGLAEDLLRELNSNELQDPRGSKDGLLSPYPLLRSFVLEGAR